MRNRIKDNFFIKNKIILIPLALFILAGCFIVAYNLITFKKDWVIKVNDVSKDCYSNTLYIYSNKDYAVLSAVNPKIIAKGKSNYPKTIDYLKGEIKKYPIDKERFINYRVKFSDGDSIIVDQESSPELKSFIKSINVKNLFWCD